MKNAIFTTFDRGVVWRNLRKFSIPFIVLLFMVGTAGVSAQPQCVITCYDAQVSLGSDCQATITPGLVADTGDCAGPFLVQVFDQNMQEIPTSPVVTGDYIDEYLIVRVTDQYSGNSCWSTILVEDKMPPVANCTDVTMGCWELPYYPGPTFTDNCDNYYSEDINIELINEVVTPLNCDDEYIKEIVRTWKGTDPSGNYSTCQQTILLERIDTSLLDFPDDRTLANQDPIQCDANYDQDGDGVVDPSYAGVPTLDGLPIYPLPDVYCNILVTFTDNPFPPLNCVEKIMRVWQVREWWCNQEIVITVPQIIEIVDEDGPSITCPDDFTTTTMPNDCNANVFLPPATVSDLCSDIDRVDVSWAGGFLPGSNGGYAQLPVGDNIVTYTAYDECYNSSTCTVTVTVEDDTPPVPVCDEHTAVSLTNNGRARVYAETFDDGSHDECGIDRFEVRRMNPSCGYDDLFRPYVEFSCCDIPNNPIMVVMRVYDNSNNHNDCMVEVNVQDKLPAMVVCPSDITISCEFPYDMADLSIFGTVHPLDSLEQLNNPATDPRQDIVLDDPGNPNTSGPTVVGMDGYAFDNCDVTITVNEYEDIGQCGEGFIYRAFTAEGPGGPSTTCTQVITVQNYDPFNGETDILWPDDVTINGGCGPTDTDPSVTGMPIVDEDECDLVAISQPDDWVFNFNDPNDPACYKILRKWKVIDWCDFQDNQYTIYTHQQVIKVINTIAPTITDCDDVSVCSYDPNCADAFIEVEIDAFDDCTTFDNLDFDYDIDLFNDGTFDYNESNNPFADPLNGPNQASGVYPVGVHRIVWGVEDLCGNRSTCEQLFEVRNCKSPTPVCINGLAAELMPMDTDGDGIADWAEIVLPAVDFDAGSFHTCYDSDDLIFSYSSDTTEKTMLFDCDDLGDQFVQMWVTAPNGAQDFCNTFVNIQDNNDVCPPIADSLTASISGIIETESDESVVEVRVDLIGGAGYKMTDENGYYRFGPMGVGGSYTIDPNKNDDVLNGVTTYDLALLQRHILQIEDLESPYKQVAADADMSGELDILDIVELRKVILGVQDEFTQNDSWRFIDAEYQFTTDDPLNETFNEEYRIPDFNENMMTLDFTGVKIGDLNGSASPDGDTRALPATFELSAQDVDMKAGETYEIALGSAENRAVISMQYTFQFDPELVVINGLRGGSLEVEESNYNAARADRGVISFSWNAADYLQFSAEDELIILSLTALEDGKLSDVLHIGSAVTPAEVYSTAGAEGVALKFENATNDAFTFELFQNRPNPFSGTTVIGFNLPEASQGTLTIMDINGKVLRTISGEYTKGYNEISIEAGTLAASGVMYYRLDTRDHTATKKMIVLE